MNFLIKFGLSIFQSRDVTRLFNKFIINNQIIIKEKTKIFRHIGDPYPGKPKSIFVIDKKKNKLVYKISAREIFKKGCKYTLTTYKISKTSKTSKTSKISNNIYYIINKSNHHINTTLNFDNSFKKYSKYNIIYYDYKNLKKIKNIKDGILVISYSSFHTIIKIKELISIIKNLNIIKISFIQDEYYDCDLINNFISKCGIKYVFGCLNTLDIYKIYKENIFKTNYKQILTSYVDTAIPNLQPIADRKTDIFYRGKKLHYSRGRLGYLKYHIGEEMIKYSIKYGVNYDIKTSKKDKVYGDEWIHKLTNSKVMLGTLSGSNVINRDLKLENQINKMYKTSNKNNNYLDVLKKFNIQEELNVGQISPKMFEAINCKTVLVLFEGNYSNILVPDIHYISLKEDFSNIESVMDRINDNNHLQNIANRTYNDIVKSGKYSYQNFISYFDKTISSFLDKNKTIHIIFMKKHLSINCIAEYILSFRFYSHYNVKYYDINDSQIYDIEYGIILIMYDVATYLAINKKNKCNQQINFFKKYKNKKAFFKQDEYDNTDSVNDLLNIIGIDIVFTCINKLEDINKIYYKIPNGKIKFVNILTGYIPESLINYKSNKIKDRNLHICYRGRELSYRYGSLGQDKVNIGIDMRAYSKEYGLNSDIEVNDSNRIYGDDWYKFISNSKTMLATESGCNIIDYNKEILINVNKLLDNSKLTSPFIPDNPKFTYDEIVTKLGLEETLQMNQVSPKMFEAIALGTVLVMYEGEYSGILKANEHYISLKKDYSNIDEVVNKIKDDQFLQNMADKTYNDIVKSNKYSYKSFVQKVEGDLFN